MKLKHSIRFLLCIVLLTIQNNNALNVAINQADLIIFSYKRPMQLYALLESLAHYVTGLRTISVLYRADDEGYEHSYQKIQSDFPHVIFVKQSHNPIQDFKPLLLKLLKTLSCDYCMFATDDNLVKEHVALQDCIQALQKTNAYGFYLRLGKNITHCYMANTPQHMPSLIPITSTIFAWDLNPKVFLAEFDWAYPNTVDMTLYPKQTLIEQLSGLDFNNPTSLESAWFFMALHEGPKLGLCFAESKIINIPHNKVQNDLANNRSMAGNPDELHELFKAGYCIDIAPLHCIRNNAAHMEYTFNFIPRKKTLK